MMRDVTRKAQIGNFNVLKTVEEVGKDERGKKLT